MPSLFFKFKDVFFNITNQLSHVLLGSESLNKVLISMSRQIYGDTTHISRSVYYDFIEGILLRNDMNPFVSNIFHQM